MRWCEEGCQIEACRAQTLCSDGSGVTAARGSWPGRRRRKCRRRRCSAWWRRGAEPGPRERDVYWSSCCAKRAGTAQEQRAMADDASAGRRAARQAKSSPSDVCCSLSLPPPRRLQHAMERHFRNGCIDPANCNGSGMRRCVVVDARMSRRGGCKTDFPRLPLASHRTVVIQQRLATCRPKPLVTYLFLEPPASRASYIAIPVTTTHHTLAKTFRAKQHPRARGSERAPPFHM